MYLIAVGIAGIIIGLCFGYTIRDKELNKAIEKERKLLLEIKKTKKGEK